MIPDCFRCFLVEKDGDNRVHAEVVTRTLSDLPDGDVLIRVEWSSLNYKDALAATGHAGVARKLPLVPGIDAAGTVVESSSPKFLSGDQVLVTGYDLGVDRWGGWSEFVLGFERIQKPGFSEKPGFSTNTSPQRKQRE